MKTLKSINYEKIINTLIGLIATFILACLLSEFLFNYVLIEDNVSKVIFLTQIALLAFYNVIARHKIKRLISENKVSETALKISVSALKAISGALSRESRERKEYQIECRFLEIENVALQNKNKSLISQIQGQSDDLRTLRAKLRSIPIDQLKDFCDKAAGKIVNETAPVLEKEKKTRKPRKNKEDESGNN